jgi:glycosyltransferase involved in cell wall biosynthesis
MLAEPNARFVTPVGDEPALARALAELAGDEALRRDVGEANRARARAEYEQAVMVDAYRAVYAGAMRRPRFA